MSLVGNYKGGWTNKLSNYTIREALTLILWVMRTGQKKNGNLDVRDMNINCAKAVTKACIENYVLLRALKSISHCLCQSDEALL